MVFYLVRHGKADYSNIDTNDNCSVANLAPLSKEGIKQAVAIKPYIQQLKNPIIVSSPYTRTLQTAYIASSSNDIKIDYRVHEWLPDKSFRIKINDIAIRNQYFKTNTQNVDYETEKEMEKRFHSVIDDYKKEKTVVIFSHARVIASFLKNNCFQEIYLKNCQIAEIIYEDNIFHLNRIF